MTRRKRRQLHELPVRACRYGERCLVCLERIDAGELYFDGGHGRRAHRPCAFAVDEGRRREPSKAELWELDQLEQAVSWAKGGLYQVKQALKWGHGVDFVLIRERRKQLATAEKRLERFKEGWGLPQEGPEHG